MRGREGGMVACKGTGQAWEMAGTERWGGRNDKVGGEDRMRQEGRRATGPATSTLGCQVRVIHVNTRLSFN